MRVNLVSLSEWIDEQYRSYPNIPQKQRKEEVAADFGCGVATLYRWLKAGDTYVEHIEASMSGDDSYINVWHMKTIIA